MTLVPSSPVLVPDDDDDITILEVTSPISNVHTK